MSSKIYGEAVFMHLLLEILHIIVYNVIHILGEQVRYDKKTGKGRSFYSCF